jgi:prepilin-type N-terminal cleavage/methylation domain-containing protein
MFRMLRLHARSRLRAQHGFTMIELLVVLVILGILLGGLTQLFTSGTNSEVDQNNRVQAQQQARVGLNKLRSEVRCASTVTVNSASSITLTLPGYCIRTTLSGALTLPSTTINVVSTAGFSSGSNTISFANSSFQTAVTCGGVTAISFTGCSGGDAGTYPSGALVTSTSSSSSIVTWCIPTTGSGSSVPYSLERFVGSCGSGTGTAWSSSLFSNAVFSTAVVPTASLTPATSGGTLGEGSYLYDVTAVLSSGSEMPGTLAPLAIASGTTNVITLNWSAYPGAVSYNVYGRDNSGVRLLTNTTGLSYVDTGPTSLSSALTLPASTIPVVSTANYNSAANSIYFGPSGTVTCTGTTSTSFTGCAGGQAGDYPSGTNVYSASTVRPPALTLTVTLVVDKTPSNTAGRFTLTDNVVLRNSRPF